MTFERASGILLHPSSLPGRYGIGDLGSQAYDWVNFLVESGCGLWQVLPLGPTGYGDSPYQCFSSFAGNPYLVSPDMLLAEGLLTANDLVEDQGFPEAQVDYGPVIQFKVRILDQAFDRFETGAFPGLVVDFESFQAEQAGWLEDFALFMALKDAHGGAPWFSWPAPLRDRQAEAIQSAQATYRRDIRRHAFRQFLFFRQWRGLRAHANGQGIRIIGDIPIFVANDSADVWANPELFFLDESGAPTVVAGVPPDYFSPTGQLWGNPLYRWDWHARQGYDWWIERLRAVLNLVDIVRLDHFRGFAGYWEIPADKDTAEIGRWIAGPGLGFFQKVRAELGELPIIAEDLGEITSDVVALRRRFELPGMKILQFAFTGEPENDFLPHNFSPNCVVYTGTHDNDTTRGWYERVEEQERDFARRYLNRPGSEIAWDLIRIGWSSVAVFALAPMQDFLGLDNRARMNYPGRASGNWSWRMPRGAATSQLAGRIRELNYLYGRLLGRDTSGGDPAPPPDYQTPLSEI